MHTPTRRYAPISTMEELAVKHGGEKLVGPDLTEKALHGKQAVVIIAASRAGGSKTWENPLPPERPANFFVDYGHFRVLNGMVMDSIMTDARRMTPDSMSMTGKLAAFFGEGSVWVYVFDDATAFAGEVEQYYWT